MVEFYFVHKFIVYGLLKEYKIVETKEHINTVSPAIQLIAFNVKEVEKKLLYIKVNKTEFLTAIPNGFEKS